MEKYEIFLHYFVTRAMGLDAPDNKDRVKICINRVKDSDCLLEFES